MSHAIRSSKHKSRALHAVSSAARPKGHGHRDHWHRLGSFFAILFTVGFAHMLLGGQLRALIQPIPFVLVGTLTFLFAARSIGFAESLRAFRASLFGAREDELQSAWLQTFSERVGSWAMFAAHMAAILGLIRVMSYLSDPSQIGPGMAVAFLAYLYGGLFAVVLPSHARARGGWFSGLNPSDFVIPGLVLFGSFYFVMHSISGK